MSLNSTPGHTSSSSYESHYDPSFTAEITSRMHVPDKICVIEGAERPDIVMFEHEIKSKMNVPERIVVAGDNKHIAMREALPELQFDTPLPYQLQNFVLAPPPDVLTVDEYPYPTLDSKTSTKTEIKKRSVLDPSLNGTVNDLNESSISAVYAPEEEVAILRRQVRHLSRRVLTIEQENQQRQQREIIMYTLCISYFFMKGLVWLHRHF